MRGGQHGQERRVSHNRQLQRVGDARLLFERDRRKVVRACTGAIRVTAWSLCGGGGTTRGRLRSAATVRG
jgi:hypothetical protein